MSSEDENNTANQPSKSWARDDPLARPHQGRRNLQ